MIKDLEQLERLLNRISGDLVVRIIKRKITKATMIEWRNILQQAIRVLDKLIER